MPSLRLAAAQLNTVVGDLAGNVEKVLAAVAAAEQAGADLCIVPELAITGYPPEDLLLKPGFVADNLAALEKVAAATGQCTAVVGFVGASDDGTGLANAAAVCARGRVAGIYRKRFLPTTASSTSSAGSCPARSRLRCSGSRVRGWACPSARTCGSTTDRSPTPAEPARTSW